MSRVLVVNCYSTCRQFRGNCLQIVVWLTLLIVQPWKTLKHGSIFLRMLESVCNKAIGTHLLTQYRQLLLRWSSDVTLFFLLVSVVVLVASESCLHFVIGVQYYLKTGTCKFGATCKYHHPRDKAGSTGRVHLNVLGLPLRQVGGF